MATKRQIEEQDQASANRRTEACVTIVDRAGLQNTDERGAAVGVLNALIEAIDGERDDITELRRKGWQTKARECDAAILVIKEWRDDLAEYTPPRGKPEPAPIAVDHRAKSPAELDARLQAAFPDIGMPERHIRTTLEFSRDTSGDEETKYGALCGSDTGSWTHPGGANCTTCHALYAEQTGQPYAGPVAHGTEIPAPTDQIDRVLNSGPAFQAIPERPWHDGPVTPEVARAMREAGPAVLTHEQVEGTAGLVGGTFTESIGTPDPEHKIGDTVTVAGVEFTKIGDDPFGGLLNPATTWPREADGSPSPGTPADAAMTLNLIDPTGPRVRQRMSAAQVREHGLSRQRGLEHRSVSQVEGFSDCGTRYALSNLETPAWWNVGGKALHRCVETINRAVADGDRLEPGPHPPDTSPMWLQAFDAEIADQHAATPEHPMSTWRAAKRGLENYDWWRVEGPPMVEKYVAWLRGMLADGWEIARTVDGRPVIELEVHTNVGAAVPNLSIIDLALYHAPRDLVLVVDVKAGNSAPKSTFQLGVYGWALLGVLAGNLRPDRVRGAYYRARTGELVPSGREQVMPSGMPGWPILAMHPWADVVQRYRETDMIERQGVYMPNVTTFCGGCGVRDLCPAQATAQTPPEPPL